MSSRVVSTDVSTIFEVKVQETAADESCADNHSCLFKILDKIGKDSQVTFDGGKTWHSTAVVYAAIKAFEDRYPMAL